MPLPISFSPFSHSYSYSLPTSNDRNSDDNNNNNDDSHAHTLTSTKTMTSGSSHDLLDITSRKCSFSTSLNDARASCAFPSWPNRPSLLDSATTPTTSTTSTPSISSSRLTDDDLWPSDLDAPPPPSPPKTKKTTAAGQGKWKPFGDCAIVDDDDNVDGGGDDDVDADDYDASVQPSRYLARLAAAVEEEEARARFMDMIQLHAKSFELLRGRHIDGDSDGHVQQLPLKQRRKPKFHGSKKATTLTGPNKGR